MVVSLPDEDHCEVLVDREADCRKLERKFSSAVMPPKRKKSSRGRKVRSFSSDRPSSGDEHGPETMDHKVKSPTKPTRTSTRQAASRAAACITAAALQESWPRLKSTFPKKSFRDDPGHAQGKVVSGGVGAAVSPELERPVLADEWPFRCNVCSKSFKYKKCIERHVASDHKTVKEAPEVVLTAPATRKRKASGARRESPDGTRANKSGGSNVPIAISTADDVVHGDADVITCVKVRHVKSYSGHEVTKENSPENKVDGGRVTPKNGCSPLNGATLLSSAYTAANKEEKLRKLSEQLYRAPSSSSSSPSLVASAATETINFISSGIRKSVSNRTCQFCGKVCPKPSDLQRHLMKHTGEQPFQCDLCQRRFKAKPNLLYHLRSAHGKMINLSPALVAKFASTKKYKQDYHYFMRLSGEWSLEGGGRSAAAASVESVHSGSEGSEAVCSDASMLASKDRDSEEVILKSERSESQNVSEKSDAFVAASDHHVATISDECKSVMEAGLANPADDVKVDRTSDVVLPVTAARADGPNPPPSNAFLQKSFMDGAEDDDDNGDAQVYSIASLKDWDGHTPSIVRYKVNPRSEEALVTRMIGMNLSNGEKNFLYKCHWCAKVFLSLNKLQSHLTTHLRRSQKTYVCFICGEIFQLKSQLRLHSSEHVLAVPSGESQNCGKSPHPSRSGEQAAILDSDTDAATSASTSKIVEPKENVSTVVSVVETARAPLYVPPVELSKATEPPLSVSVDNGNCTSNVPFGQEAFSPLLDLAMPALRVSDDGSRVGYHCHYCDKIFDRVFSLNRHERVHTGIKACYCKDCGRGFSEPRNLRHHIIRFHSDGSQRHLLRRCGGTKDGFSMSRRREAKALAAGDNSAPRLSKGARISRQCTSPDASSSDSLRDVSVSSPQPRTLSSSPSSPPLVSPKSIVFDGPNDDRFRLNQEQQLNVPQTSDTCNLDAIIPQPDDLVNNLVGEDGVTVIYPTDVPENANDSGTCISGGDLPDHGREILSDPKRSLIGSLRKQKSYRSASLAPKEPEPMISLEPLPSVESGPQPLTSHVSPCLPLGTTLSVIPAPLMSPLSPTPEQPAAKKKNHPDHAKTDLCHSVNSDQPQNQKNWNLGSIVSRILSPVSPACVKEPKREPRKRKRKVNNGHFSYSPRLNVVEKPVQRADVCKPRILPDGRAFFECCYCNKKFGSVSDINRHMDFHEDVRPYKCHFCNYYSRTNSQLKVHMMRHQGIKQYLCEVCHYCGVTQSDLNRHKKTQAHCLRARNVCKLCGLGYFTRQQKVSHMLSYHLGFAIAPEVEKLDESVEKLMLAEASSSVDKKCDKKQKLSRTEGKTGTENRRKSADKKGSLSDMVANELSDGHSNGRSSLGADSFGSLPVSVPVDFSLHAVLKTSSVNGQLKLGATNEYSLKRVKHSFVSGNITDMEQLAKPVGMAGKEDEIVGVQGQSIPEVSSKRTKEVASS